MSARVIVEAGWEVSDVRFDDLEYNLPFDFLWWVAVAEVTEFPQTADKGEEA